MPYTKFTQQIETLLTDTLQKLNYPEIEIQLEEPPEEISGDIGTTICFELAAKLKTTPQKIAQKIIQKLPPRKDLIDEVNAQNGYINFSVNIPKLADLTISTIQKLGVQYGHNDIGKGKTVLIEHTSANPNGPLHIGHGRNAILGDALARILKISGYNVKTQFYVNDMGRQIAIVVWGLQNLDLPKKKGEKLDHYFARVYVAVHEVMEKNPEKKAEITDLIKRCEAKDEKITEQFKTVVRNCLTEQKKTLQRLGVYFDDFIWESRFVQDGSVQSLLKKLKQTDYIQENDVLSLNLESYGLEKELILTRKDGTTLYPTRDIAYHIWKNQQASHLINLLGADHKLEMEQLRIVLELLGYRPPQTIFYEFLSLPEGTMSTRRGLFVAMDDLIAETVHQAHTEVSKRRPDKDEDFRKETAEIVGVGAIRFDIVRIAPEKSMVFRWDEALDFERQGAPFIAYAHARACRILEKAEKKGEDFYPELLTEEQEKELIKVLAKFPYVVRKAARELKPALIADYAQKLATVFNQFYQYVPVLKAPEERYQNRLLLVDCFRIVVRNVLNLLGIVAPREM